MGLRSKRGLLDCFFAETVGWRAPTSVDDDVRGMKRLGGGEMVADEEVAFRT